MTAAAIGVSLIDISWLEAQSSTAPPPAEYSACSKMIDVREQLEIKIAAAEADRKRAAVDSAGSCSRAQAQPGGADGMKCADANRRWAKAEEQIKAHKFDLLLAALLELRLCAPAGETLEALRPRKGEGI